MVYWYSSTWVWYRFCLSSLKLWLGNTLWELWVCVCVHVWVWRNGSLLSSVHVESVSEITGGGWPDAVWCASTAKLINRKCEGGLLSLSMGTSPTVQNTVWCPSCYVQNNYNDFCRDISQSQLRVSMNKKQERLSVVQLKDCKYIYLGLKRGGSNTYACNHHTTVFPISVSMHTLQPFMKG